MVRRKGKIPTKKLWIFCEGKTEKNYFYKLKQEERISRLDIRVIKSGNTDAKGIVNYTFKFIKARRDFEEGDLVCCVFDRDQNSNTQLRQAEKLAKENNILITFSNPSFEYWFLCHFGYFPERYETRELISKITEKANFTYVKKDSEIFLKTKNKIENAIENARKIRDKHIEENIKLISRESNPLTLVFKLIQKIDEFKN